MHTHATERVDTHSGRVLAAASRIGTSVAEERRASWRADAGVPGVGRYLIRLDTMRDCCPCSALPLHTFALVFVRSRRSVQVSCTLRRSRPCLCPATRAAQTVATVAPATSPSTLASALPDCPIYMHACRSSPPTPPIEGNIQDIRCRGGTDGGIEIVRAVEYVALAMVFFCRKFGKSFLVLRDFSRPPPILKEGSSERTSSPGSFGAPDTRQGSSPFKYSECGRCARCPPCS